MKKRKSLLSMFLALSMALSLLTVYVFANDPPTPPPTVLSHTVGTGADSARILYASSNADLHCRCSFCDNQTLGLNTRLERRSGDMWYDASTDGGQYEFYYAGETLSSAVSFTFGDIPAGATAQLIVNGGNPTNAARSGNVITVPAETAIGATPGATHLLVGGRRINFIRVAEIVVEVNGLDEVKVDSFTFTAQSPASASREGRSYMACPVKRGLMEKGEFRAILNVNDTVTFGGSILENLGRHISSREGAASSTNNFAPVGANGTGGVSSPLKAATTHFKIDFFTVHGTIRELTVPGAPGGVSLYYGNDAPSNPNAPNVPSNSLYRHSATEYEFYFAGNPAQLGTPAAKNIDGSDMYWLPNTAWSVSANTSDNVIGTLSSGRTGDGTPGNPHLPDGTIITFKSVAAITLAIEDTIKVDGVDASLLGALNGFASGSAAYTVNVYTPRNEVRAGRHYVPFGTSNSSPTNIHGADGAETPIANAILDVTDRIRVTRTTPANVRARVFNGTNEVLPGIEADANTFIFPLVNPSVYNIRIVFDILSAAGVPNLAYAVTSTGVAGGAVSSGVPATLIANGTDVKAADAHIGGVLSYQWQRRGSSTEPWSYIEGATNRIFNIPTTAIGMTEYRVIVTNTNNNAVYTKSVTGYSQPTMITVNASTAAIAPTAGGTDGRLVTSGHTPDSALGDVDFDLYVAKGDGPITINFNRLVASYRFVNVRTQNTAEPPAWVARTARGTVTTVTNNDNLSITFTPQWITENGRRVAYLEVTERLSQETPARTRLIRIYQVAEIDLTVKGYSGNEYAVTATRSSLVIENASVNTTLGNPHVLSDTGDVNFSRALDVGSTINLSATPGSLRNARITVNGTLFTAEELLLNESKKYEIVIEFELCVGLENCKIEDCNVCVERKEAAAFADKYGKLFKLTTSTVEYEDFPYVTSALRTLPEMSLQAQGFIKVEGNLNLVAIVAHLEALLGAIFGSDIGKTEENLKLVADGAAAEVKDIVDTIDDDVLEGLVALVNMTMAAFNVKSPAEALSLLVEAVGKKVDILTTDANTSLNTLNSTETKTDMAAWIDGDENVDGSIFVTMLDNAISAIETLLEVQAVQNQLLVVENYVLQVQNEFLLGVVEHLKSQP